MKKQLEVGCKVVITKSMAGNKGKVFMLTKYLGKVKEYNPENTFGMRWEIDGEVVTNTRKVINHLGENQIERIDDYDGNEKISWGDMEDIWNPKNLVKRKINEMS
jgi:hypothetical protein